MKAISCIRAMVSVVALLFTFIPMSSQVMADVVDIDNAQLQKLLSSGVPIIDIRLRSEWEETGVVAGSKLLTFFDERGRYDAGSWLELAKGVSKKDEPVILICRSGNRTKMVSQFMSQQAGYSRVYNVKHGLQGWLKNGGAVVRP